MENKENMIMRDGEFATMMQQQEEDEVQKLMEREQRAMSSTLEGKALILTQSVLSLQKFLQYSIPPNLDFASKVTTLATDSMFFFADRLLRLQAVFRVSRKRATLDLGQHYTNSSSLGMICTNILMNPVENITNRATANFLASLPMISGLLDVFYTTVFLVPHFVIFIVNKLMA